MAKKLKFESFIYLFLNSAKNIRSRVPDDLKAEWDNWVQSLSFVYQKGVVEVGWVAKSGDVGKEEVSLSDFHFYTRGDDNKAKEKQRERGVSSGADLIKDRNSEQINKIVRQLASEAGLSPLVDEVDMDNHTSARYEAEEVFHDQWASTVDVSKIDVRHISEAITSPELRYIRERLGDLKGKTLLDVGCGLGEASVYFALEGANVTAMDISSGMLETATRLAEANNVKINTHKSAAEETRLGDEDKFDVIYAGNLLHHVDIEATLKLLKPHLAEGGQIVTWDPLAYNPAINVYRRMAEEVRTEDEHPLKWRDIKLFKKYFRNVETRYFWLTSLVIFIIMAVLQRRDPNKERFWKTVVDESDRWAPIYRPLAFLDKVLLTLIPPLRLLCWNVVIVAKK